MGVPVTLGSDAHTPDDVARDFDKAVALLRDAGYSEMATFDGGKMRLVPLG
jgi:histidinol-phosphatase (PHP family)